MSEINHENVLIQLRDALQRNSIKLWLEPYCIAGESNESEIVNLAKILSQQLNISFEITKIAISEMQNTALDNLRSIDDFEKTGVATIKIRVPSKSSGTQMLCLKIKLSESAKFLQEMIASKLSIPCQNIKIIANGKVLEFEKSLIDQGVKNNKQIMAVITEEDGGTAEDPYARIKKIRSEAELLLKSKDSGFLNIEDQSGKAVHLPESERKAIILALLLYEKGRVQLKNDKFSDALILFLEADDELKFCNSQLVQSVDNVALLNLDIVWCYLNLKSITQLPDAENRLRICEENFKRSYGENLSRVQTVKGSSENEKTLITRLRLMQGILYFHQNRREEAKVMIAMAERDIQALKVDEHSVAMLIEMGYTRAESVNGLRSSFNSIDGAVNFILDRRQKFAESRIEGSIERGIQKFLEGLGIKANPRSVSTLSAMGFPKELCAFALQKSNDDITQALNLLQCNQEQLKAEMFKVIKPNEEHLEKLVSLGFDKFVVENILKLNVNDFQQALEALLATQSSPDFLPQMMEAIDEAGGPSTSSNAQDPGTSSQADKKLRKLAEKAAFDNLTNDLDHLEDDDEYLTTTLEKEEALLFQYKSALNK